MAISFDHLNDTVGKDLSTLILQRRNQGSVGLSVHIALEYPWKTEKKMDVFGFSDKWSCLSTPFWVIFSILKSCLGYVLLVPQTFHFSFLPPVFLSVPLCLSKLICSF